jgi:hypothetical protein
VQRRPQYHSEELYCYLTISDLGDNSNICSEIRGVTFSSLRKHSDLLYCGRGLKPRCRVKIVKTHIREALA